MSAMTNTFEVDLLELLFENTDIANIGDATGLRGASTAGSWYVALFTADPGEAGAVTNEATYTGYARKAVARNATNWGPDGSGGYWNDTAITFAQCTGGSNTITHFALCKAGTASVQDLVLYGALDSSLAVSNGVTPEFAANALVFDAN